MTVTVNRKGSKSMSKKRIKSICIYCGSRLGISIEYAHSAKILGETIARNNLKLVYGGGNIGLMGVLAESCRKNNGRILGVMPHMLTKKEQGQERGQERGQRQGRRPGRAQGRERARGRG